MPRFGDSVFWRSRATSSPLVLPFDEFGGGSSNASFGTVITWFVGATAATAFLDVSKASKTEVQVTVNRKGTACSTVSVLLWAGSTSLALESTIATSLNLLRGRCLKDLTTYTLYRGPLSILIRPLAVRTQALYNP